MHKPIKGILTQIFFSLLLSVPMLWSSTVWGLDTYTERKVRLAAVQCEHALAVKPPKTKLALRVLQRYFKKYVLYRDAASARDSGIWASEEQHPTGKRFVDKTYSEILAQCERELPRKLKAAETALLEYQAKQTQITQQKEQSQQKQRQQAMQHVKLAVSRYCQQYLRQPVPETLNEAAKAQLNQDYAAYTNARKAALALSSDIQQLGFKSVVKGAQNQQFLPKEQSIREWFDYCEIVFAEHLSKTVEAEGPPVPVIVNTAEAEVEPIKPKEVTQDIESSVEQTSITFVKEEPQPKVEIKLKEQPAAQTNKKPDTKSLVFGIDKASEKETTMTEETVELKNEQPADEEVAPKPIVKDIAKANQTEEKRVEEALLTEESETTESEKAIAEDEDAEETEEVDEEYLAILKKAKADRTKILKKEKRLPEYLDEDQEDALASKEWFFEDYDKNDNPSACRIYVFSRNKLKEEDGYEGSCFEE